MTDLFTVSDGYSPFPDAPRPTPERKISPNLVIISDLTPNGPRKISAPANILHVPPLGRRTTSFRHVRSPSMATKLAAVDLKASTGLDPDAPVVIEPPSIAKLPPASRHIPLYRTDTPRPIAFGPPPDATAVGTVGPYDPIAPPHRGSSSDSADIADDFSAFSVSSVFRALSDGIYTAKKRLFLLYSSVNARYPLACMCATFGFIALYLTLWTTLRLGEEDIPEYDGPPIVNK